MPADDPARTLTVVRPDDQGLTHLAVVGDTYTVLVTGADTAERFAVIDMLVPAGGGPPPHRHDFEESFHVLEGELEVVFRGEAMTLPQGATAVVPANAPHAFANRTERTVRLLCTVAPAGLERYFEEFGDPVPKRTSPAPELSDDEMAERMARAVKVAPSYGIQNLPPE